MKNLRCACLLAVLAFPTFADISVEFDEGAPKDRFTLRNDAGCPLGEATVMLDLGASRAGLIFDVAASGAGISVFQPLEVVEGAAFLGVLPQVRDGDSSITLVLTDLAPGASVAFTIDVDDTAGSQATIVSGSEIEGAKIVLFQHGAQHEAVFGSDARARLTFNPCNA